MQFNPKKPDVLHIDINSCFATIEQQANPFLRGKPIAIVAYNAPNGCILAASIEAKKLGIKTGMNLSQGRAIYPRLISLLPDPDKYRNVREKLRRLLTDYSLEVIPKSIDEFVLQVYREPITVSCEIKKRIKSEIGEWITVSIGISTNKYLAKVAAGLQKPDGLTIIDKNNYLDIYSNLKLTDLTGIKKASQCRFLSFGIKSVMDLYNYPKAVLGCFWGFRLHGYEVDLFESKRKSFSNQMTLKITPNTNLASIEKRLLEKAKIRAYRCGFKVLKHKTLILHNYISVSVYDLVNKGNLQLDLFENNIKKDKMDKIIFKINQKWGNFVIGSARGFMSQGLIKDQISFGR